MASEEEISLLVIVVDVNPIWWGQQAQREPQFTLSNCMDAVMVMANAHVAMSRINKLAVIASHCKDSHFLYPSQSQPGGDSTVDDACSSGEVEVTGGSTDTMLAGSLAKALCYINRVSKELEVGQEVKSRILVIKAADDCALQYMNFMNVIFAAQKQSILIDACVLESDSGLLQQACDITGGLYLKIPQKAALAQYLLWVFLPDGEQRSQLLLPPPAHVDYRAACFCHRNLIQIGYVCSVCLSIFCNFSPICTTCETAFKIQLPQMVKGKKKKFKPS
ncbi:general transcription factor IIH subunit 3 isoform X3 [Phycodurus eques]|uniref:general transcription factor IIH subunit 3 isoform X3 n=1 Tax=Phycodurus eques TaxID=693459 RepID=UPI002ACF0697|nr:general transcription factor IIH subunit 3 isoform X3 [Phycodurus eques]